MWAVAPETEGVACGVGDPVEEALCKRPELRGMKPAELARVLRVTPARAQVAILSLAAKATGKKIVFQGISFDDAIAGAGGAAPRSSMRYSEDAGGFLDTVKRAARDAAPFVAAIALFAGIALDKPSE